MGSRGVSKGDIRVKQHTRWWKRVYTEFIKNKTRKEISETTWRCCLEWVQTEAERLRLDDMIVDPLLMLSRVIDEELDSK